MFKRITAIIGIIILLSTYVLTAIFAAMAKPGASSMFMVSLVLTLIVPVLMWLFIMMVERKQNKKGISLSEVRKMNKRIKNGEAAEKIAEEIEEKYKDNEKK